MAQDWRSVSTLVDDPATAPAPAPVDKAPYTPPAPNPFDPNSRLYPGQPGYKPPSTEDYMPQQDGAASRYVSSLWKAVDPTPLIKMYAEDPNITTFTGKLVTGILGAQWDQLKKAKEEYDKGNHSEALGHALAGVLPVVGPMAAESGEQIGSGDIAGGLGTATAALAPFAKDVVKAGTRAAVSSDVMQSAMDHADRMSGRMMAKTMTPTTGAQKSTFGAMAEKAAPTIAREPGLGAVTRQGLLDKLQPVYKQATDDLNGAYAGLPDTGLPTKPIKAALQAKLDAMKVEGQTVGGRGGGRTDNAVIPTGARAERAAALQSAIDELDSVGNRIDPANLRKLAMAWGDNGQAALTPKSAPDALKMRAGGQGWADAERTLRDGLSDRFPQLKEANARYSLLRNANDAMQAAEDADLVRTGGGANPTRRAAEAAVGAGIGAVAGGPMGAVVGGIVGAIIDSAIPGGVTLKIGAARGLARFADAVRAGKGAAAEDALMSAARTAGVDKGLGKDAWPQVKQWLGNIGKAVTSDDTGAIGPFVKLNKAGNPMSTSAMLRDELKAELQGWHKLETGEELPMSSMIGMDTTRLRQEVNKARESNRPKR